MATAAADRELIEAVVAEMSAGIDCALEFWMSQIDAVFENNQITTLGRLQAIQEILRTYHLSRGGGETADDGYAA